MNFFNRILHYYIYDMRLKKKLVVSHTILFLIPTAVLICFLFLNIFRIVMDDTIRSEQALSSQSVLSVENLVSHVTHASDTLTSSYVIRDMFDISNAQAQSLIPSRNKINNLLRLADTLTDHSLIESVTFYSGFIMMTIPITAWSSLIPMPKDCLSLFPKFPVPG